MSRYSRYSGWAPYIPVAKKKKMANKKIEALKKKGKNINPVVIEGRSIATTFWGKAWCKNLEAYSDYAYRLPRGRSYVRNGAVVDLKVTEGSVEALVDGASLYTVKVTIGALAHEKWQDLVSECTGKIDSLVELLQGKFSKAVMEIITHKDQGLFPHPNEIKVTCSCPDYASLCKHVAAALYGIGSRLDQNPELLFLLRGREHLDLITSASSTNTLTSPHAPTEGLEDTDLSSLFGIEINQEKRNQDLRTSAKKGVSLLKKKGDTSKGSSRSSPKKNIAPKPSRTKAMKKARSPLKENRYKKKQGRLGKQKNCHIDCQTLLTKSRTPPKTFSILKGCKVFP